MSTAYLAAGVRSAFALRSQQRAAAAIASGRLELHDRAARRAVATMCIGVGQGIAVLLEAA